MAWFQNRLGAPFAVHRSFTVLRSTVLSMILLTFASPITVYGGTLEDIRARGVLECGTIDIGPGLSTLDETGDWQGLFPDFCRFFAAAVLGDSKAVTFTEVNTMIRFDALRAGAFDVLMANTTWTASRDNALELAFPQTLYYDGQGFMAHRSLDATTLDDLTEVEDATVCVADGTTTIKNLKDLIEQQALKLEVLPFNSTSGMYDSFFARDCDLVTQDRVGLVAQKQMAASRPDTIILFPEIISKEPLGPAVRQDDPNWFDIVQWSVFAALIAEEHGIHSRNIDDFLTSSNTEIRRLLGVEPGIGAALGLSDDWAYQGLSQVGSYGEIFDRTLGQKSPIMLDRGLNGLWTDGGLMYAPPMR